MSNVGCPFCYYVGRCTGQCAINRPPATYQPYSYPGWTIPEPKGCICPPGSEKTCQRKDCGRKEPEA